MNKDGIYLKVGIVVLLCAVAGVVVLVKVGKLRERFEARQNVEITFENAQGVKRGAPVLYSGVHIGTVREIIVERWDPSNSSGQQPRQAISPFRVLIQMDVKDSPDMPIGYDDVVTIYTPLVMGDPVIRIVPMGGKRLYQSGKPLHGSSSGDIAEMLTGSMGELGPLIYNLRVSSDKIRELTTDEKGIIGILTSDDVADGLTQTLHDLQTLARSVKSLGISDILSDNKIADRIVSKWWDDNVDRRTPVAEVFTEWKAFVHKQKTLNQTLIYMDPKFPKGPPWKKKELREWATMTAKEKKEAKLKLDFEDWKELMERKEYEQWKYFNRPFSKVGAR